MQPGNKRWHLLVSGVVVVWSLVVVSGDELVVAAQPVEQTVQLAPTCLKLLTIGL